MVEVTKFVCSLNSRFLFFFCFFKFLTMFASEILRMFFFWLDFNLPHVGRVTVSVIRSHFVGDSSLCARLMVLLVFLLSSKGFWLLVVVLFPCF